MGEAEETWIWLDDGLGRNVYYINNKGKKISKEPPGFSHRHLDNGERAYCFKGKCVNCYKTMSAVVLSRNRKKEVFSLNICGSCMLRSTNVSKLKGNGDVIYEAFTTAPKTMFINAQKRSLDPDRERSIHERARTAKYAVLRQAKARRNVSRYMDCKIMAGPYNISIGSYASWGFGQEYDEYFGKVSSAGIPHGYGVKFYSDGTVYVGEWSHGRQHTSGRGTWTRPNGSSYEGNWMQGRKHGKGEQVYVDGRVYTGEFANGFEHGHGRVKYPDGSLFEGRFRFGRRDGPGVFKPRDGAAQKGNFKEKAVVPEMPPPEVSEEEQDNPAFFQPDSLLKISLEALSEAMRLKPHLLPSPVYIQKHCLPFLKPLIGEAYLSTMTDGGDEFRKYGPLITYSDDECISLREVRMSYNDIGAFIYFTEANAALKTLHIVHCRLKTPPAEVLCRNLSRDIWPLLAELDLSFSKLEHRVLSVLASGLRTRCALRKLRLAGCQISYSSLSLFCDLLTENIPLQELDIAFNNLSLNGAEVLSQALIANSNLVSLNVRHNNIGRDGGVLFAEALRYNSTLNVLCIADNQVGEDVMSLISARLHGNISQIKTSICFSELEAPAKYVPENYGVLKKPERVYAAAPAAMSDACDVVDPEHTP